MDHSLGALHMSHKNYYRISPQKIWKISTLIDKDKVGTILFGGLFHWDISYIFFIIPLWFNILKEYMLFTEKGVILTSKTLWGGFKGINFINYSEIEMIRVKRGKIYFGFKHEIKPKKLKIKWGLSKLIKQKMRELAVFDPISDNTFQICDYELLNPQLAENFTRDYYRRIDSPLALLFSEHQSQQLQQHVSSPSIQHQELGAPLAQLFPQFHNQQPYQPVSTSIPKHQELHAPLAQMFPQYQHQQPQYSFSPPSLSHQQLHPQLPTGMPMQQFGQPQHGTFQEIQAQLWTLQHQEMNIQNQIRQIQGPQQQWRLKQQYHTLQQQKQVLLAMAQGLYVQLQEKNRFPK